MKYQWTFGGLVYGPLSPSSHISIYYDQSTCKVQSLKVKRFVRFFESGVSWAKNLQIQFFFARWKRLGGPNYSYHIRVGSDPNLLSKLTGAHSCLLSLSVFSLADVDTNPRTCKLTKLLIWANMISGVFPEALRLSVITYLLSFASRVSSNKNVSLHFMIFLGEQ